ncbi:MAG: twin-arginine translocation signal domain-containing protein [Actinomycetota bacterium]|nr:twin-arginine translocation signal domain-containing protein [Actinomycetota bacterium]
MDMNRREFLRAAGLVGGAAMLGGPGLAACADAPTRAKVARLALPPDSVLAHPASECPIDTVVVLMMENRSFDHYLGWLGKDAQYIDEGRRRYGKEFQVDGQVNVRYRDQFGVPVPTRQTLSLGDDPSPFRGCNHKDPGHSWDKGRVQRDFGFLASGTGNDSFAASYYMGSDLPIHAEMARRFTVMDQHHAALLGPTWPNRQYLYSADSEGLKTSLHPLDFAQYSAPTIFEKLRSGGVSAAEYFTNLPVALLWGARMFPFVRTLDTFFEDAANGTLPNVTFLTPWFGGPFRTDDHPHGDIALGQRYIEAVFSAFVRSPQWQRGMFALTYDEWGGFFDHVHPPVVPDARASGDDMDNFGQLGFRVPSLLASPYARPGYVDHNLYDHTSILRFLEWRFLGAPAQGTGKPGDRWFLTKRDRNTNNYGASLRIDKPDADVDLSALAPAADVVGPCDDEDRLAKRGEDGVHLHGFEPTETLDAIVRERYSPPTFTPWLEYTKVHNIPVLPDDRPR